MSAEQPTVVLELRPGQLEVTEMHDGSIHIHRQDAIGIGAGLESLGIKPAYVDFGNRASFTDGGMGVKEYYTLDPDQPGSLVRPSSDTHGTLVPDAYRVLDIPESTRPALAQSGSGIPGYNSGELCTHLSSRTGMQNVLYELGFGDQLPPAVVATDRSIGRMLGRVAGDIIFVKPELGYSDVATDTNAAEPMRRTHYMPRGDVEGFLQRSKQALGPGFVYLQEDIAAPLSEITERLGIDVRRVPGYGQRKHHTIRIYHMPGAHTVTDMPDAPYVAEVRLVAPKDIGKPAPSYCELYEPDEVFEAFADTELALVHRGLMAAIGSRFVGPNCCAADYFLTRNNNEVVIDALHVRPGMPKPVHGELGRRTAMMEVGVLGLLATQASGSY